MAERDMADRLRAAGCVFAEEEAAVIAAAAGDAVSRESMVQRRAAGEPLEQVVGYADFAGVRVRLRPGVFVPRVRSELLVRLAAKEAEAAKQAQRAEQAQRAKQAQRAEQAEQAEQGSPILVDLCCGSGALGMAVRKRTPHVDLHAADLDPTAVGCARDNGIRNVYQGDLFDPLPRTLRGRVDILVANVPYVATTHLPLLPAEAREHEPATALDGGDDGLDIFRRVAGSAPKWLAPHGVLLSEITEAQQNAALEAIRRSGLDGDVIYDEDLEARVVRARRS